MCVRSLRMRQMTCNRMLEVRRFLEELHFTSLPLLRNSVLKWYTWSNKVYAISFDKPGPSGSTSSNESTFCYCNGPEEGDLIACDNKTCGIEWFHTTSSKIPSIPKGLAA